MGYEKRDFKRHKAVIPVDYQIDEDSLSLFNETLDISRSGVYFCSSTNIIEGIDIDLIFSLFGKDLRSPMETVSLKGHVIRTNKLDNNLIGVGVKYYSCDEKTWVLLERAIAVSEKFNPIKAIDSPNNEPLDRFEQGQLIRMYSVNNPQKNAAFNSNQIKEK